MPVDQNGTRADVIMDAYSTVSRTNPSRLYETYINSASFDLENKIRKDLNIKQTDRSSFRLLSNVVQNQPELFHQQYNSLMHYYDIVSSKMANCFSNLDIEGKTKHMLSVITEGIYLYMPVDNDRENSQIVRDIEQHFRPVYGPVTYVGNSGKTVKTVNNVRISRIYMMLLDKTGDGWSASSSGKLQHFGILAPITKADKFSQPARNNPIKGVSETEGRILDAYAGITATAEVMDRNNCPATQEVIALGLITAPDPMNIVNLVDRDKFPYGGPKPVQLVNHIALCSGWEYVYTSKKPGHVFTSGTVDSMVSVASEMEKININV